MGGFVLRREITKLCNAQLRFCRGSLWGSLPACGRFPRGLLHICESDIWVPTRTLTLSHCLYKDRSFEVKPFGRLVVQSDQNVDVNIRCLNPQKYPLQNLVVVNYPSDDSLDCKQQEDTIFISAADGSSSNRLTCDVDIPIKFDVDVVAKNDSNISVQTLENDEVKVQLDSGKCSLKSIQTGNLQIESSSGDVECRSALHCNGSIRVRSTGSISGDRVLGLAFHAETDAGNVDFKAMYADVSTFVTKTGSISVKNCHRDASFYVSEKGNIKIGSHDGNLKAELKGGDVDVYIAQHEKVDIQTKDGCINVKVPQSVNSAVSLQASNIHIDDQLLLEDGVLTSTESQANIHVDPLLGKTHRQLNLSAGNGSVSIACQDWLSSLNLLSAVDLEEK